jgi:NAD(P)H-hydrate epimerase
MPVDDVTYAPLPQLPARAADSHKGDYGRALLIGGSRGMSGAIAMAGLATLRSGAGLVTPIQDVVAGYSPCYMTRALADDGESVVANGTEEIIEAANSMNIVAIGPGIGRSTPAIEFVLQLYRNLERSLVVDADGLFALATAIETKAAGPRILTPHPGEFARLMGRSIGPQSRTGAALDLVRRLAGSVAGDLIVVLKGHQTIVASETQLSVNQTGNPGMATGGTGDVLTGVVTALSCQGLSPFDAARLGIHLHGLAGDMAAQQYGQVSLIASDVLEFLPAAFQSFQESRPDENE